MPLQYGWHILLMAIDYIKMEDKKNSGSSLSGSNFSNPWAGKKEIPLRTVELVHSPYVPINFTALVQQQQKREERKKRKGRKRKLLLDTGSTPAGYLINVPLVMHKRVCVALVTFSKNHGGNRVDVYSLNNASNQAKAFFVPFCFFFVCFNSN